MMKKLISNTCLCPLIAALFFISMQLSYSASYRIADKVVQSGQGWDTEWSQQQKILVCTTAGIEWVSVSDLLGGKQPLPSHSQHQCTLCTCSAYSFTDLLLSDAFPPTYKPLLLPSVYFSHLPALIQTLLLTSLQARAPPYFV